MQVRRLAAPAAAVLVAVSLIGPTSAPPATADHPLPANGPLLSWVYDIGQRVQSLDYVDAAGFVPGVSYQTPFRTGAAAFSPDGSMIAHVSDQRVRVRHADGGSSTMAGSLPDLSVEQVQWTGDGEFVVVTLFDDEPEIWRLWRVSADEAPVEIHTQANDDPSGLPAAVDPHAGRVAYVENTVQDFDRLQEIFVEDVVTGEREQVTDNCRTNEFGFPECDYVFEEIAWAPDGRLLLAGLDRSEDDADQDLFWLDPSTGAVTPERELADEVTADMLLVSPAGTNLAWRPNGSEIDEEQTVVAAIGGPVVATLDRIYHAWQPCPDEVCPSFARRPPDALPAPTIGKARSGARGGTATARARWTPPDPANGLKRYEVEAAEVDRAGNVVWETVRGAGKATSIELRLHKGRYQFRVRAVSLVGPGAWSAYSNVVRSR